MKSILRFISRIFHHIYNTFKDISDSSAKELKTAPLALRIIALMAIILFAWSVFSFTLHAVVLVISVTINTIFINRLFKTDQFSKNKIVQDFSRPFFGMGIFALGSLLYFLIPELTIVLSIFVIPQLFGEVTHKYEEYKNVIA